MKEKRNTRRRNAERSEDRRKRRRLRRRRGKRRGEIRERRVPSQKSCHTSRVKPKIDRGQIRGSRGTIEEMEYVFITVLATRTGASW